MTTTLRIEALGAQGDGVAQTPGGTVYVPFALPGESVSAEVKGQRGRLLEVETPSPRRVPPACRHFGTCGGCAVQHLEPQAYAAWKREKVVQALASRGLDAEVAPLLACPPASRRRLVLTARVAGGRALLGFNAAQSHRIVDIEECPVAMPQIVAALPGLRRLAVLLMGSGKPFRLTATATAGGLDIAAEGAGAVGEKRRQQAVAWALAEGHARLSLDGEVLVERARPTVDCSGVAVVPPPGGFLQAVAAAEEAMAALAAEHLQGARHVADLFAGSGAFALRLAAAMRVHAVEGEATALAALETAARAAPGLKPLTAERRDLFHRPLTTRELAAFDGLVFDPPRAGAEAQSRQIARSAVRRVAAVSCNPGTLARDLAILVAGGYRLVRVVPIDQFLWSPHVEAVALLERARR
ncbi:class I SAM-dependent RNA methyltransferase [Chelativorans intermedius]|uniref:Class I SAM-dependent RNA methyltransferase n=1 Tax=Chelativorans intermedius TaxID=515947 RepID=A0ABV6DA96_9HYPH|nr:class I SAM-dependent RNA methyltransferase [Chelativorans intermedius]MCT8998641.1 class I SAM-dependent RNA methyltransferase [Chelativorans intermedius]